MATRRTVRHSTKTRYQSVRVKTGNVTKTVRVPVKIKTRTEHVTIT